MKKTKEKIIQFIQNPQTNQIVVLTNNGNIYYQNLILQPTKLVDEAGTGYYESTKIVITDEWIKLKLPQI